MQPTSCESKLCRIREMIFHQDRKNLRPRTLQKGQKLLGGALLLETSLAPKRNLLGVSCITGLTPRSVKRENHWRPASAALKPCVSPALTRATEEKRLCNVEQEAEMRKTLFMVFLGLVSRIQD